MTRERNKKYRLMVCPAIFVVALVALFLTVAGAPLVADWDDTGDESWSDDDWNDDDWGSWDSDDSAFDISGYLESSGIVVLPRELGEEANVGLQTILRLRSRFEPSDGLSVVVEGEYRDRRGAANPLTRQALIGAPGLTEAEQQQFVGTDFTREFVFDYAYGSASFGPLDLRVGRQPLAWGSAYAFNPTEVMNPSSLAELTGIEPPGITAVAPSLSLGTGLGLEGYIAFEDRSRQTVALSGLSRPAELPFGIRARAYVGRWDLAAGFARSVEGDQSGTLAVRDYAVSEVAGSVGPVTVYGESAVEIAPDEEWELERSVDAAAGFQYELPFEVGLQAEYHRRGSGAGSKDDYDPTDRISGRLAARDYLVGILDYRLLNDDLHIVFAGLSNLNDQSIALIPEATYTVRPDFELGLGSTLFLGPDGSEFDGRFSLGDDNGPPVDTGRPQVFLRGKWYF